MKPWNTTADSHPVIRRDHTALRKHHYTLNGWGLKFPRLHHGLLWILREGPPFRPWWVGGWVGVHISTEKKKQKQSMRLMKKLSLRLLHLFLVRLQTKTPFAALIISMHFPFHMHLSRILPPWNLEICATSPRGNLQRSSSSGPRCEPMLRRSRSWSAKNWTVFNCF